MSGLELNKEVRRLLEQLNEHCSNIPIKQKLNAVMNNFIKDFEYLKHAIDSSTTFVITDKTGIITYVNDKFCTVTQYSREEVIGKTHEVIKSGYHSKEFYSEMWKTILVGEIWSGEIKNRKKDGTFYWVHSNIIPIINEETNEIEQFIALRTDITKGKEAEEKLRKVIQNDFERTIRNLDNMVFKVKRDRSGDLFITLVEGKLSRLLDISEGPIDLPSVKKYFGVEQADIILEKYSATFKGKKQSFKHHYNGLDLYTTLSPIEENGEIVEIIGNTNDITILELAQSEIKNMAYHDDLTNLPNRRKLSLDFQEKLARNTGEKYGVLFIDIDRFKQINDTLGFHRGDKLIIQLAKKLERFVKEKGTVFRLGGDEFIIILENYKNDWSFSIEIQTILQLVEEPFLIDDHELLITCSVGVSIFPRGEGDSAEKILNRVDTSLKYCKLSGKQGYIFYSDEMSKDVSGRLDLEINLRKAIRNDELTLHYQPKYLLDTEQISGMEALVRWNSPSFGFISPGEFIPLAEETGLIVQLGEWVLYNACKQNQEWINKGYEPMRVAVNVSTIELLRPNFVNKVKRVLKETGLDPNYVELEITENSVMSNFEKGIQILNELRNLGIHISIDDFGTGYSSFGYLKRLPINALKIDKSFIQDITNNESDAAIVKAIIQLSHTFQLKVVAEGVESNEAAQILDGLNCDIVQGFYYSKPLPADLFEKLLGE